MDRRQALRRLAAGGAIAMGSSTVMSSRSIAFAASPPCFEPPANPWSYTVDAAGFIVLADTFVPSCDGASTSYSWRIFDYGLIGASREFWIYRTPSEPRGTAIDRIVQEGPDPNRCRSCPTGYTTPNVNDGAVVIARTNLADTVARPLGNNTRWDVGVLVSWTCTDGCPPVVAEYRIAGNTRTNAAANPPVVTLS